MVLITYIEARGWWLLDAVDVDDGGCCNMRTRLANMRFSWTLRADNLKVEWLVCSSMVVDSPEYVLTLNCVVLIHPSLMRSLASSSTSANVTSRSLSLLFRGILPSLFSSSTSSASSLLSLEAVAASSTARVCFQDWNMVCTFEGRRVRGNAGGGCRGIGACAK